MSQLSKLLNERKDATGDDRSTRRMEEDARREGHVITHTTIARYLNGHHPVSPSPEIISALSHLFQVDADELRRAAGKRSIGNTPFILEEEAALLNEEQRQAVRGVVRAMLNQLPKDKTGEQHDDTDGPHLSPVEDADRPDASEEQKIAARNQPDPHIGMEDEPEEGP